jgi:predicted acylesterase/phospholipase RssA
MNFTSLYHRTDLPVRLVRHCGMLWALVMLWCVVSTTSAAGTGSAQAPHSPDRPTIALVLSGGGARGLAHVGVLRALERNHIPIDYIVGSSMGAIIGGLYASGYTSSQLTQMIDTTDWATILSLSDDFDRRNLFLEQKQTADRNQLVIRFNGLSPIIPSSITTGQNLSRFLNKLMLQGLYHPRDTFDDFKIPFRAVATDMISGKRIVIKSGNLSEAMRASVGVPLLYSAVKKDSMQLIDGGLTSNIPVDVARALGADIIIAVDVTSPLRTADQLNMPWEIADQIIGIMAQASNKKSLDDATIVVNPILGKRLPNDFTNFDTLIAQGDAGVEAMLPRLRDSIAAAAHRFQTYNPDPPPADPLIRSIVVSGAVAFAPGELTAPVAPLLPTPASGQFLRVVSDSILTRYRSAGYSLARIKSEHLIDSSGTLQVYIDEGVIDRIVVEGNTRSRDWVVWRELPFKPHDIFTFNAAERAIANLLATNLFEQAFIDFRYEHNQTVVVVQVTEKRAELVRLGIRVDNERNGQPMVSMRDENVFGTATEAGVAFAGGLRNRTYSAELKTARIFNTYFNFKLSGGHSLRDTYTFIDDSTITSPHEFKRLQAGEYRTLSYGAGVSIGRQVERLGIVSLEYRLESVDLHGLRGITPQSENYSLQTFRLSSTIDALDQSPYSRSGSLMNVSWETATVLESGTPGYSKMYFSYEWYNTYYTYHTFHPRVIFGYADKTMPLSKQFTLGGETMLYGTREDDSFGRQIFLANFEYRLALPFKIVWDSYASIRYDIGAVWAEPKSMRLEDMQHGIGGGISIDSPIGPVSLTVGRSFIIQQNLPKSPVAWGPMVSYFSIGYPL